MEAALLGLLSEKSMYPYEMEKNVVDLDMRYWTEISLSSIYKVLEKLEKKLLVDVNLTVTDSNKVKKVYSLTDKGKTEIKEKIVEILSEVEHSIHQIDLGLANLHLLTPNEVNGVISRYIESLDKSILCYQELEQYLVEHECEVGNLHLSRRRQFLLRAEKEWATFFLDEYNSAHQS